MKMIVYAIITVIQYFYKILSHHDFKFCMDMIEYLTRLVVYSFFLLLKNESKK